jgi:hypothetical protein
LARDLHLYCMVYLTHMENHMSRLKAIALFFASPFIALAYVIALPFVGMYMFVNLGVERSLMEAGKVDEAKVEAKI